jgi:hypothetical protein
MRFDLQNIKTLCFYCHIEWWHKEPTEAVEWFQQKFPDRWRYIQEDKNGLDKTPDYILEAILEERKKDLKKYEKDLHIK